VNSGGVSSSCTTNDTRRVTHFKLKSSLRNFYSRYHDLVLIWSLCCLSFFDLRILITFWYLRTLLQTKWDKWENLNHVVKVHSYSASAVISSSFIVYNNALSRLSRHQDLSTKVQPETKIRNVMFSFKYIVSTVQAFIQSLIRTWRYNVE
jgi:hypothetical protein